MQKGGVWVQKGHLTQNAANSAAQISAALGERSKGRRGFSGATSKKNLHLSEMMLPDLRVCPCLEKGGAPRWAAESTGHRIGGSPG